MRLDPKTLGHGSMTDHLEYLSIVMDDIAAMPKHLLVDHLLLLGSL